MAQIRFEDNVVHMGLPEEQPPTRDEQFSALYAELAKAKEAKNGELYVRHLADLVELMRTEVKENYGTSQGDRANTMNEFARQIPSPLETAVKEALSHGQDVRRRSNTLNNQRSPHGSRAFTGDPTDEANSEGFGKGPVDFANTRGCDADGNKYITAQLVSGRAYQSEPVSSYQVEITVHGMPT